MTLHFSFDNSYARLPEGFFARVLPFPAPAPRLLRLNRALAEELGLDADALSSPAGIEILAGRQVPVGADPIATAYAGHQFGQFVPQLGDGRAILLGEVIDRQGRRRDIQLKGAGRTPFSRRGDGKAALGPVMREYIVSEAMAALGLPTTRALAAVVTGEEVIRDAILPGAVLTRVAASHIRVGTFQFFAARGDDEGVARLLAHVIERHYPQAAAAERPALAMLEAVIGRQAELVARWLGIGFIHGVMNTDNMSIAGETIDYGPCAFLDAHDPAAVFSSIDHGGRYAYSNQPRIAQWNLARLAETLVPLIDADPDVGLELAKAAIAGFPDRFKLAYGAVLRAKLGLSTQREGDEALAQRLLDTMAANQADFTLTFRQLCEASAGPSGDAALRSLMGDPAALEGWLIDWRARLALEPEGDAGRATAMRRANPAIIPRNHRIEEAIAAAVGAGDLGPFETLVTALANPYEDQPAFAALAEPPRAEERVTATFCGT